MKVNIFKCLTLSLLLCSIQLLYAGRIYDEFEDIYKITWIGNSKLISGTTDDWAQRAGDIYRLKIDDPSNYSFLVYELPENEIAHEVIVDYYSPTGLRPTLAVKNSAGEETKYVEGWDNGYPEITDKGHGLYRCTLKDSLIPEDATQVVIYLDAQSDIELLRNIVYYGDGYQAKNYNEKTNYYRVQKLLEKAESGNDITIGVIGGSMTAGANAEPMETNCYGARLKTWFESTFGIDVNFINIGIGSTNSYFGCIRAEEKLLRFNPDLIIIEYACNDQLEDIYLDSYESLIRKCWKNPGEPAVISLMLCTQAGISKIERQYPIAQHCQIPIVSYNNAIKDEIIKGEKTWLDYYQTSTLIGGDGIHPNTTAHQKIADLIATELLEGKEASTMLEPTTIINHILPQTKRIIDLVHHAEKKFLLHSCGNIFEIMPDIITLGIDAKHSNEDQIAPFDEWIKRYNGQIGLFGGFDVNLLSLGTYQSVYDEVLRKGTEYRRICKGYGLGSGNSIASYVSVDGFRGMIDAVKQIRRKEK